MKKLLVISLSLLMAGCASTGTTQFSRLDPNRGKVVQSKDTATAGLNTQAPVLIRIIKEDRQLELWKISKSNVYEKIKTFDICAISGELGPKKKQGDRQGPEGFYDITPGQLNPYSAEYLSINTGYPNARDRAHGYSGSALMIHGGCSSAGCYAITDSSMEELYASVRDAMKSGKNKIQLQIYPFRMTGWRMYTERKNPNYNFWSELKLGWDYFDSKHMPIPVNVKDGKYFIQ